MPYRTHATLLRHTILGTHITHAAWTSQPTHPVHRTTHMYTYSQGAHRWLCSLAQALCPARLILSCRHTDRRVLAGNQTVNLNARALPCCHFLGAGARILSSFAQSEAPSLPPFPTLEAIPSSISSEASRNKAGVPRRMLSRAESSHISFQLFSGPRPDFPLTTFLKWREKAVSSSSKPQPDSSRAKAETSAAVARAQGLPTGGSAGGCAGLPACLGSY